MKTAKGRVLEVENRSAQNIPEEINELLDKYLQNENQMFKELLFNKVKEHNYKASDDILAFMAREGDQEAKKIISEKYVPFVEKIVKQLVARGRYVVGYDFEDLVQTSYISFFESINDYKIEMNNPFNVFSRYVIYRHVSLLIDKSNNNKSKTLNSAYSYGAPIKDNEGATFEQLLKSDAISPEDQLENKEKLYEVWNMLSDNEKKVIWYYSEGYSYQEIGEMVFEGNYKTKTQRTKAVDNTLQRINKKRMKLEEEKNTL